MTPDAQSGAGVLSALIGTWSGRGTGSYPTIDSFDYDETLILAAAPGKPFLSYGQRTVSAIEGRPLHAETGYLRPVGDGRVELVLAHPFGVVEIEEGTFDGRRLDLATTAVHGTSTALPVDALERTFELDGDVLRYTVRMAAVGVPLTHHLAAELHRRP